MSSPARRLRFGTFEIDTAAGRLTRDGRTVKIQPQPLRILAILAEHRGEIVSREQLRTQVWDTATFVEFDQGLNYCIRQIRLALDDDVADPTYLETIKRRGYRFIAPVVVDDEPVVANGPVSEHASAEASQIAPVERIHAHAHVAAALAPFASWRPFLLVVVGVAAVTISGGWLYPRWMEARHATREPITDIRPITDFADSAVAPALSPDGRMVAFIRGNDDFLTPDQIYVKMLPDGPTKRLTDDPRLKYGPAFSPDGSEVAYTAMDRSDMSTYAVSVLGGEPHLVLSNAAGLTWLDRHRLLFSQVKTGQHMGIVTGLDTRADLRELYLPAHERAMAHYSYPSPDRTSALVVEMGSDGSWLPCRLIPLNGRFPTRNIGPEGPCHSAGWSPDGRWMYFAANVAGRLHLWRQETAGGTPEQLTFGATEEGGIAIDPDGRSLITSIGADERSLWVHDDGDRQLSSEGEVLGTGVFSADGQFVYYVVRHPFDVNRPELERVTVKTGTSEPVLPGVPMFRFDVSRDGSQVVYTTPSRDNASQVWLAAVDRSAAPAPIGMPGDRSPLFGAGGEILFAFTEGTFNYLGRMNQDGSGRAKVVPYPIGEIQSASPAGNWVMAIAPLPNTRPDTTSVAPVAVPVHGGSPVRICEIYCHMAWSTDGRFLLVSVEEPSLSGPGRTLAIPVGPGEALPALPPMGIPPLSEAGIIPGARSIKRADLIPGPDPDYYAYVHAVLRRNLFRVMLPSQ